MADAVQSVLSASDRAHGVRTVKLHIERVVGSTVPGCYFTHPLVRATSLQHGMTYTKEDGAAAKPVNGTPATPAIPTNGHATKPAAATAQTTAQSTSATPLPQQPLRYLSGQLVDMTDTVEVQAFQQFVVEKQTTPQSRPALRTYC